MLMREPDADERTSEVDRKRSWWERTGWWMSYHLRQVWTEWSSCWAIPFFLRIRRCLFLSKLEQSHFYVFVCFLSTLSLHWAVPQISFVFTFVCRRLVLVQLVASTSNACDFCQRDTQSVCVFLSLSDSFLPRYPKAVSLYLWKPEVSFEYLQYRYQIRIFPNVDISAKFGGIGWFAWKGWQGLTLSAPVICYGPGGQICPLFPCQFYSRV